MAQLRTY